MTPADRARISQALMDLEREVAEAVTEAFFLQHPDWLERYGARGRDHGIEDASYHMRFLAGSVQAGAPQMFRDYARWTARMLAKRGIAPAFVEENIGQVRDALAERLSGDDTAALMPFVAAGLEGAAALVEASGESADADGPFGLTCSLFTQAILNGERVSAVRIVEEALADGASALNLHVEVLQEAMYRVGRRWENNEISVAQEHMATAITQFVISTLYPHLERSPVQRGNMVLTGIQGELHQVGAMMLGDVLEADGWHVRFLGTNMPMQGILDVMDEQGAEVLGISTAMVFNLPRVIELIDTCRARSGFENLRIIVGGGAFHSAPESYKEVGADAFAADLRAARLALRDWGGPAAS